MESVRMFDRNRTVAGVQDAIEILGESTEKTLESWGRASKAAEKKRGAAADHLDMIGVLAAWIPAPKGADQENESCTIFPDAHYVRSVDDLGNVAHKLERGKGLCLSRRQLFDGINMSTAKGMLAPTDFETYCKSPEEGGKERSALTSKVSSVVGKLKKQLENRERDRQLKLLKFRMEEEEATLASEEGREAKEITDQMVKDRMNPPRPAVDRISDHLGAMIKIAQKEENPTDFDPTALVAYLRKVYPMIHKADPTEADASK